MIPKQHYVYRPIILTKFCKLPSDSLFGDTVWLIRLVEIIILFLFSKNITITLTSAIVQCQYTSCTSQGISCLLAVFRFRCLFLSVQMTFSFRGLSYLYKVRHAHKRLCTVLPKYNKIQVLPGITSCRLMKDNNQQLI